MAQQHGKGRVAHATGRNASLYTLEVFIISGPMTDSFMKENREVSRTIQIRGDQTLEDLHYAVFKAFDREEEHMYEFQLGGKGPMDPKARRYVLSVSEDYEMSDHRPAEDIKHTTIASLGLKVDDAFGYWFDFGGPLTDRHQFL